MDVVAVAAVGEAGAGDVEQAHVDRRPMEYPLDHNRELKNVLTER